MVPVPLFCSKDVTCCSKSHSVRLVFVFSFFNSNSTESISGNKTHTFLITLDRDLGELMLLKLTWERSALWRNMWNQVQNIIPWGGRERKPLLTVGKINVKAGESQERYSSDTSDLYKGPF